MRMSITLFGNIKKKIGEKQKHDRWKNKIIVLQKNVNECFNNKKNNVNEKQNVKLLTSR